MDMNALLPSDVALLGAHKGTWYNLFAASSEWCGNPVPGAVPDLEPRTCACRFRQ